MKTCTTELNFGDHCGFAEGTTFTQPVTFGTFTKFKDGCRVQAPAQFSQHTHFLDKVTLVDPFFKAQFTAGDHLTIIADRPVTLPAHTVIGSFAKFKGTMFLQNDVNIGNDCTFDSIEYLGGIFSHGDRLKIGKYKVVRLMTLNLGGDSIVIGVHTDGVFLIGRSCKPVPLSILFSHDTINKAGISMAHVLLVHATAQAFEKMVQSVNSTGGWKE